MKNTNLTTILLSGVTAAFLIGCGGGGSTASTTPSTPASSVPTGTYTVSVVDDVITGAKVTAPECAKTVDNGGGSYTLKECISAPSTITAVGGSFSADGVTINQTAPLILKTSQLDANASFVVTPFSTLASQESNLTALANALGVDKADLFKDNANHRSLMRAVNAILIAAREAGITKYDMFVGELKEQIKTSSSANSTGLAALVAAKAYMMNSANLANYKAKYGVVFGGFVNDASALDLTSSPLATVKATNTVTVNKVRLGGFVYDNTIANADITIYDGATIVGSGKSNSEGRYSIEIDASLLATSKVLRLEAISGTTKLIAYITTDELKAGTIGSKISSATVEDLVISNVTTAKAVLVDQISSTAKENAVTMVETKAIVETMYADKVLEIASAIRNVVDDGKPIVSGNDTLQLATAVAQGTADTTTYTDHSDAISNDPVLQDQLNSTEDTSVGTTTLRSMIEGKALYEFGYDSYLSNIGKNPFTFITDDLKADGSSSSKYSRNDSGTNWIVYKTETLPVGTMKWSSDNTILYDVGDVTLPKKHTLLSKESIKYNNISATIYFIQNEVVGEGSEGFFTNFAATSHNIGSYDSTTRKYVETASNGRVTAFYLGTNNYIQSTSESGTNTMYHWEKVIKYGKEFIVIQWNDYRAIYYVSNGNLYKKDYNPIGTVNTSWSTDSLLLLSAYKNMDTTQRDSLEAKIKATGSSISKVIYDYIKSLVL